MTFADGVATHDSKATTDTSLSLYAQFTKDGCDSSQGPNPCNEKTAIQVSDCPHSIHTLVYGLMVVL